MRGVFDPKYRLLTVNANVLVSTSTLENILPPPPLCIDGALIPALGVQSGSWASASLVSRDSQPLRLTESPELLLKTHPGALLPETLIQAQEILAHTYTQE